MAQVMSDTPGRLRVRLRPERRHETFMRQVHGHLQSKDGIKEVETNARTGSVTVRYDPRHRSATDVLGLLRDLGVIAETMTRGDVPDLSEPDQSTTASGIVGAIDDLDERIAQLTGYKVDLKLLFPLGLGVLGAYKVIQDGFSMGDVPGYVLLWYAFDSFFKFHVQAHQPAETEVTPQRPRRRARARATAGG
jgi:hypothetical protein